MDLKVLAVSCSKNGVSEEMQILLNNFINGMKDEGATVEQVNIEKLNIKPCRGCTDKVEYQSNGKCQCEDDMNSLLPKFRETDVWIFADSLSHKHLSPELINVLDRMEPLFNPVQNEHKDRGQQKRRQTMAFLSASADFEVEAFGSAVNHFKSLSRVFDRDYAGSLLRPHSWALNSVSEIGEKASDVFNAVREAGRQIVCFGKISNETQKAISRELLPKKSFIHKLGNIFFL